MWFWLLQLTGFNGVSIITVTLSAITIITFLNQTPNTNLWMKNSSLPVIHTVLCTGQKHFTAGIAWWLGWLRCTKIPWSESESYMDYLSLFTALFRIYTSIHNLCNFKWPKSDWSVQSVWLIWQVFINVTLFLIVIHPG